jgi:hypothetical protein
MRHATRPRYERRLRLAWLYKFGILLPGCTLQYHDTATVRPPQALRCRIANPTKTLYADSAPLKQSDLLQPLNKAPQTLLQIYNYYDSGERKRNLKTTNAIKAKERAGCQKTAQHGEKIPTL